MKTYIVMFDSNNMRPSTYCHMIINAQDYMSAKRRFYKLMTTTGVLFRVLNIQEADNAEEMLSMSIDESDCLSLSVGQATIKLVEGFHLHRSCSLVYPHLIETPNGSIMLTNSQLLKFMSSYLRYSITTEADSYVTHGPDFQFACFVHRGNKNVSQESERLDQCKPEQSRSK